MTRILGPVHSGWPNTRPAVCRVRVYGEHMTSQHFLSNVVALLSLLPSPSSSSHSRKVLHRAARRAAHCLCPISESGASCDVARRNTRLASARGAQRIVVIIKQVTSMPSQSSSATPPNRSWQARSGHMWGDHDGACVTNPDVRVKNFVRVPVLGCLAQKGLERCACVHVGRRAHVRGWMWVCG
jgi:hypothetical protein